MGLLDKMKAGVANTGNYTSQKADEASITRSFWLQSFCVTYDFL